MASSAQPCTTPEASHFVETRPTAATGSKSQYDVFISYRRDGGFETARHLYDLLTRDGYSVSFDLDSLRSGRFDTALLSRIDECTDFIIVLNPRCFDRTLDSTFPPENDWLRQELARALEMKKNVVPVRLAGFDAFPEWLPDDVMEVTKMNGPQYSKEYFDSFYGRLKKFLHSQGGGWPADESQGGPQIVDQTSSPGEEITTEQLFPDKQLVDDPPVKSEGNDLPRRNGSRGAAIKILMVGATGAGKTVAIAGLGELASSCPDEDGYFFEPDPQTESFVDKTIARMRQGEWPTQTLQLHCLNWNIKRRGADVRKRPQTICKMSIIEFPGEFCRASHDRDIDLLKKYVAAADCIIVLISLRDVILSEGSRDRDCISKSILDAIFSDDTRVKRPSVAIALSCAGEYGDVIRACGGPKGVIEKYQPRISMNYGWLNVFAVSAVDKTVLAPDGSKVPSSDFTTKGLRPLMSWILLSRRNVATRAVRTLALRVLCVFAEIVGVIVVCAFVLIWQKHLQAEKMKSIRNGDQKAFKQINKPSSDYSVKALL